MADKLTPPQGREIQRLLEQKEHLFKEGPQISAAVEKHAIVAEGEAVKQRAYRMSPKEEEFIRQEIERMSAAGIIRPSVSPWSSPVVVVSKKNGELRFCVNYQKLNARTKLDSYPLPRVEDLLETLRGARYFTSLDLKSGYWQIPMEEQSIDKTAFVSRYGLFEFLVMPFGLTNAPATFQRTMDKVGPGSPLGEGRGGILG